MKMVASAKLHKAQGAIENMLHYQKKLNKILTNLLSADLPVESPYVKEREVKRVAIVVSLRIPLFVVLSMPMSLKCYCKRLVSIVLWDKIIS